VGGDGSVLGGVVLETAIVQEGATPTRFFFWSLEVADGDGKQYELVLYVVMRVFMHYNDAL
jgi:hypothetical protein